MVYMQPRLSTGRLLPRNDWEGDDRTPGAGGAYVTCQDTAVGRMVAFATNGRIDKDGKVYRAAHRPYDSDGVSLRQMVGPVKSVAHLTLMTPQGWHWGDALAHLKAGRGLVVDGWYDSLSRPYRYQASADFAHAIWVSHYTSTSGMRVWDPLNPDTHGFGRWIPASEIRKFAEKLSARSGAQALYVGYVPLQPL